MSLPAVFKRRQEADESNTSVDTSFLRFEPEEHYHAQSVHFLSSHKLANFRRNPLLFYKKEAGLVPADSDSPTYLLGRAAHKRILEGKQAYESCYAFGGPINPKTYKPFGSTTKAFQEWTEKIGRPVLTDDQAILIEEMNTAVHAQLHAVALLQAGVPEGVVRVRYGDTECQGRIDWFNPHRGIVDLKTCESLDWFAGDARSYGYVHQLAFYRALVEQATGRTVPVHMIAVEKREPFRCGVWHVTDVVLDKAREENEVAMARLRECRRSGLWPTGYENILSIDYLYLN